MTLRAQRPIMPELEWRREITKSYAEKQQMIFRLYKNEIEKMKAKIVIDGITRQGLF